MTHSRLVALALVATALAFARVSDAQQPPPAAPPPAAPPPAAPPPAAPLPPAAPPPAAPPPAAPAAPAPAAPAPAAPSDPAAAPAPGEPAPAAPEAAPAPSEPVAPAEPVAAEPPVEVVPAEAAPEEEIVAEPEGKAEEIVVTGSRVKRTTFASTAAVQVIDRREIEYSGATNMSDLMQYMTVSQGTGFQGSANGAGTVTVNLRGLGAGATLVLLNGRRLMHSGGGTAFSFADIGTIPLAVVERVEILKGGASAIYGTDAMGGVVNIITLKDWDGAKFQLEGQTAEEFDYKEGTVSVAYGAASERSRLSLGLTYMRRSELMATDRDFTAGPPSDWRGFRKAAGVKNALHSQNLSFLGYPGAFGKVIPGSTLAFPVPEAGCGAPGTNTVIDDESVTGFTLCTWDYRDYTSLVSAIERVSTYGYAEYDITGHTAAFTELNLSRTRDNATSPSGLPLPAFPTVPANHLDNAEGSDLRFFGRPFAPDGSHSYFQSGDDSLRVVLGLKGDLLDAAEDTALEDWEWETFASFGASSYFNLSPDTISSRFQDSLNSCADPADLENCYNPWTTANDGTGTPNSQAVIDGFTGTLANLTGSALQTYNLGVNGPVVELPGGDLGVAVGGEVRHEARSSELDHDSNELDLGFFLGNSDAAASRDTYAGYLELVFPFYDGVEVQTAGRVENASDYGTVGNPTLGLLLTPSEIVGSENVADGFKRLTFRGHIASASKAPALYQVFPGFVTQPTLLTYMGAPSFVPAHFWGRPELEPESAIVVSGGLSWNPVRPLSFEVDYWNYRWTDAIVPESPQDVARTHHSVVEGFDPPLLPVIAESGLLQRVNLSLRNLPEPIITDGFDVGVIVKLDEEELGADIGTFRVGVMGTYTLRFLVAQYLVAPVELEGGQWEEPPDCDAGGGQFPTADLENNARKNRVGDGTCNLVGSANGANVAEPLPVLRANFPASWTYDGHMVAFVTHFISGMDDDAHYDPASGAYNSIDSWTTFDLQYGYTVDDWIGDSLGVRVGVYNLADADPPFVDKTNGYDMPHDPRGRIFFGKLLGEF